MTVLTDPRYVVPPLPALDGGALDRLRRAVPRFRTGAEHEVRRAEVVRLLAVVEPDLLRASARALAIAEPGEPLVPRVPLTVLAAALGAADPAAVAALIPAVAAAYFPGTGPADDDAVGALVEEHGMDLVRVGLLVQACAPVAALVRAAVARGVDDPAVVLAEDPPVPATRRWRPDTGETVTVPLDGIPFGAGPRRCPAEPHALALAAGVLDALAGAR